jgi:hypothetical protein
VECGVWSVECGVWSVECGVCGVWSVECGVWSVECGVRSVRCGEGVKYGEWSTLRIVQSMISYPSTHTPNLYHPFPHHTLHTLHSIIHIYCQPPLPTLITPQISTDRNPNRRHTSTLQHFNTSTLQHFNTEPAAPIYTPFRITTTPQSPGARKRVPEASRHASTPIADVAAIAAGRCAAHSLHASASAIANGQESSA